MSPWSWYSSQKSFLSVQLHSINHQQQCTSFCLCFSALQAQQISGTSVWPSLALVSYCLTSSERLYHLMVPHLYDLWHNPFDSAVEYLLAGEPHLINAQFLPGGRIYLLTQYLSVLTSTFKVNLSLAFIPVIRDFLSSDNMAFLAPLLWMSIAYIAIYMTSRRSHSHFASNVKPIPVVMTRSSNCKTNDTKFKRKKARNKHHKRSKKHHNHPEPSAPPLPISFDPTLCFRQAPRVSSSAYLKSMNVNRMPSRSDADKNWRKTSKNYFKSQRHHKNNTRKKCRFNASNPYSPFIIPSPQVWHAKCEDISNLGLVQSLVATLLSWFWDLL